MDTPKSSGSRWLPEEDDALLKVVRLFLEENPGKPYDWSFIASHIPGRSTDSVKHHYQAHLKPKGLAPWDNRKAGRPATSSPSISVSPCLSTMLTDLNEHGTSSPTQMLLSMEISEVQLSSLSSSSSSCASNEIAEIVADNPTSASTTPLIHPNTLRTPSSSSKRGKRNLDFSPLPSFDASAAISKLQRESLPHDDDLGVKTWSEWRLLLTAKPNDRGWFCGPFGPTSLYHIISTEDLDSQSLGVYELGLGAPGDRIVVVYVGRTTGGESGATLRTRLSNYVKNGSHLHVQLKPYLELGCCMYGRWRKCDENFEPFGPQISIETCLKNNEELKEGLGEIVGARERAKELEKYLLNYCDYALNKTENGSIREPIYEGCVTLKAHRLKEVESSLVEQQLEALKLFDSLDVHQQLCLLSYMKHRVNTPLAEAKVHIDGQLLSSEED